MKLDRNAAISYAKARWNTVCDDGVFWLTDEEVNVERKRRELSAPAGEGWDFRFLPDGSGGEHAVFVRTRPSYEEKLVQPWEGLADCAHFLSRCLRAGGMHGGSLSVPKLVHLLQLRVDTKTLAERVTQAQGQNIVNSGILKAGDMIGYYNNSSSGDFERIGYTHSTMYVGKVAGFGRITCHTKCRFPSLTPTNIVDEWHLGDSDYTYTFIHFSDDDNIPPPAVQKLLAGWWQVSGSPRVTGSPPVFQFIDAEGHAYFTTRKPTSAHTKLPPEEKAYWFDDGSNVVFSWQKTGTVDVWTLPPARTGVEVITNGVTPRQAIRLFP